MKKILILCTFFIFYGCSMNQEQESFETKTNSGNVTKIETNSGTIANTETNTGNSIATKEQKELTSLTKKEVYELVKDYDNSSKIFDRKNQIAPYSTTYAKKNRVANEKIKDIDYIKNDTFLNQELKKFLKEIGLGFIYNLEDLGGTEELNEDYNDKILNTLDFDYTYFMVHKIDIFFIDNKYIFLDLVNTDFHTLSYWSYLYDISNGKVINVNQNGGDFINLYLFDDKLWYSDFFKMITSKFDLKNGGFNDYSEKDINKSNKWILDIQDGNLIVESVLEDIKINLGKLDIDFSNDNFIYGNGIRYFETNEDNTKFAIITNAYGEKSSFSIGEATITYGNLKKNGLNNSKSFTVNKESLDAQYVDKSNDTFYFIEDLIITTHGTIHSLELTVFDTNSEKFLYRSDYVDRSYFKDYE